MVNGELTQYAPMRDRTPEGFRRSDTVSPKRPIEHAFAHSRIAGRRARSKYLIEGSVGIRNIAEIGKRYPRPDGLKRMDVEEVDHH